MLEFFHIFVGRLKGAMHCVVRDVQEKGFVSMSVNEVNGLAGDGIGEVFLFLNGLATSDDRIVGIVVGFIASHMSRVDHFAESLPAFSSARKDAAT